VGFYSARPLILELESSIQRSLTGPVESTAFATVYRGVDKFTEQPVAVKVRDSVIHSLILHLEIE
jgi:hypothetical protein